MKIYPVPITFRPAIYKNVIIFDYQVTLKAKLCLLISFLPSKIANHKINKTSVCILSNFVARLKPDEKFYFFLSASLSNIHNLIFACGLLSSDCLFLCYNIFNSISIFFGTEIKKTRRKDYE